MAGRPFALEPFDRGWPLPPDAPSRAGSMLQDFETPGIAADEPAPEGAAAATTAQDASLPGALDRAETGMPPEPAIDPDTERLERLERIAATLETLAAGSAAAEAEGMRAAAEGFARAAAAALPSLVETGFAAEVAAASVEIASAIKPRAMALHVAPEDLEAIAHAMTQRNRDGRLDDLALRLEPDPRVAPGEAALRWASGGAEIEASTLTRLALESLDRAVARIGPQPAPDASTGPQSAEPETP